MTLACAVAATLSAIAPVRAQTSGPAPADVPAAIRATVKLTPETMLAGAQVSALRATSGPQLGDAIACLKLAGQPGGYIAVFFERGKVLSYRRAIAFDRCGEGPFTLLAVAPAPKPKARAARAKMPATHRPLPAEAKATAN